MNINLPVDSYRFRNCLQIGRNHTDGEQNCNCLQRERERERERDSEV